MNCKKCKYNLPENGKITDCIYFYSDHFMVSDHAIKKIQI